MVGQINMVVDVVRPGLNALLGELEVVLDEAQNAPLDGAGDGSLDEKTWLSLRVMVANLASLIGRPS